MRSLPSAEFSDVLPTEIGGKPAHMMTIVAESESVKIHQPYIVIAEGDYIVTLAASFTDEDRALIDQTIASITFEKNTRSDLFLLNNSKGILIV